MSTLIVILYLLVSYSVCAFFLGVYWNYIHTKYEKSSYLDNCELLAFVMFGVTPVFPALPILILLSVMMYKFGKYTFNKYNSKTE